ncbi:MAG: hypothetical protein ACREJ2_15040 [Planctomycetota bacterium]
MAQKLSRSAVAGFVILLGLILVTILATAWHQVQTESSEYYITKDLHRFANAMMRYVKRYEVYPALVDPHAPGIKTIGEVRHPRGAPACLALKLLEQGQFVDDPKAFFCAGSVQPTPATLAAMAKNPDPHADTAWYCTYAYDPGHGPEQGESTVFFGTTPQAMAGSPHRPTMYVLTCDLEERQIDPTAEGGYLFSNHAEKSTGAVQDNIYQDDSGTLGWRDSYLEWDVPANAP